MSQKRVSLELASGIAFTTNGEDGDDCSARILGAVDWALAIAAKSMTGGGPESRAFVSMRESASATTLSEPLIWQMLEVNWEM